MSDAQTIIKTGKTYALDLAERVLVTFLQAFVGGIVITQPLDASVWHAAAAGGVAAVIALVKGIAARAVGTANSASLAKGV